MKKNKKLPGSLFILILFILFSCGGEPGSRKENIKYRQYLVEGKRLYLRHCSNCHMENGEGLGRLYPPLKDSDYLQNVENLSGVICSVKYGQTGEIIVNGITFNQPMPENPWLTNLEIAEILTYIYSTWGGMEELITHQQIAVALDSCRQGDYPR
jgi:cytochrome c551